MTDITTRPYRIGFGAYNAFVWAWMMRNAFSRRNVPRFLLIAGLIVVASLTQYLLHPLPQTHVQHALRMSTPMVIITTAIPALVLSALLVYILVPFAIWIWQILNFVFGPVRRHTQTLRLTSDGIEKTIGNDSHLFAWGGFQDLSAKGKTLLLFTGKNSAMIVPRSAFAKPADAEVFAVAAAARIRRGPHNDPAENF